MTRRILLAAGLLLAVLASSGVAWLATSSGRSPNSPNSQLPVPSSPFPVLVPSAPAPELAPAPAPSPSRAPSPEPAPSPDPTAATAPTPAPAPERDPLAGRISGRVLDPGGRPVAGAVVEKSKDPEQDALILDPFADAPLVEGGSTRTDAAGRFAIDAPPGEWAAIARKLGYKPAASKLVPVATGQTAAAGDIVLPWIGTGKLHVRSTRPDGKPYEGPLAIGAVALEGDEDAEGYLQLTADADGLARPEPEIAAGRYEIEAAVEGYEAEPQQVAVIAGEAVEAHFVLKARPPVRVLVVDAQSGAPIEGADVAVDGGREVRTVKTGPDGVALVFGGVLMVSAPGYLHDGVGGRDDLAGPITVKLRRGTAIVGIVRSAAGAPVAGARVVTRDSEDEELGAESGPDGRFELRPVEPEQKHEIVARAAGHGPAYASVVAQADGATVEIVLPAAAVLEGRVTDDEGRPLPLARIEVGPAGSSMPERDEDGESDLLDAPTWVGARAGPDGTYRIEGLAAGEATVRVSAADEGSTAALDRLVELRASAPTRRDWVLKRGGGMISGRLVDVDGRPVRGRGGDVVWENPDTKEFGYGRMRADGEFAIVRLVPGSYALEIEAPGYAPVELQVAAGTTGLRVTLRRLARLRVVLTLPPGGPPVERLSINWSSGAGLTGTEIEPKAPGEFEIEVPPDTIRIGVEAEGYAPAFIENLRLEPGVETELRLALVVKSAPTPPAGDK